MNFFFTPAINAGDKLIIEHHSYCFFNPAGWFPTKNHLLKKIPMTLSDSGGYQLYSRNKDYMQGKGPQKCIVIPFVGIKKTKGVLILDPIDLCQKYGELGIDYGFTLDYPLSDNFSNKEYRINLEKSYEWAEWMFSVKPTMCPTTNLLIPLHYYTENQLRHYFLTMSQLEPDWLRNTGEAYRHLEVHVKERIRPGIPAPQKGEHCPFVRKLQNGNHHPGGSSHQIENVPTTDI